LPRDSGAELVRGAIPAAVLEREMLTPAAKDSRVLSSMKFTNGKCYTTGNVDRRKYERLEEIGWIRGLSRWRQDGIVPC